MISRQPESVQRSVKNAEFEREALPHLDMLYRFALGFTAEPAQAEDWVQDALVKAYNGWHSYETGTNARGWLLTILRNTIVSDHRRRGRVSTVDMSELERYWHGDGEDLDPEGPVVQSMVRARVRAVIGRLPVHYREAVILSDIEGLSYGEIAEVAGVPIGTVKSRIYRGRQILQEELYPYALRMGYVSAPSES